MTLELKCICYNITVSLKSLIKSHLARVDMTEIRDESFDRHLNAMPIWYQCFGKIDGPTPTYV